MKRVFGAVLLAALTVLVLGTASPAPEDYFKNNTTYAAREILLCNAPFSETLGFDEETLLAEGLIPEVDGYAEVSCTGMYLEDGSLYELELMWNSGENPETYKTLGVTAVPVEAEDILTRDGTILPEESGNTVTVVHGVSVTGIGTVEPNDARLWQNNALIFEKDGMRYQIRGIGHITLAEMAELLEFYLAKPLDAAFFAMENGQQFDFVSRSESHDSLGMILEA